MVLDIGEGQQWNHARRIYPKSRGHGAPSTLRGPTLRAPPFKSHPSGPQVNASLCQHPFCQLNGKNNPDVFCPTACEVAWTTWTCSASVLTSTLDTETTTFETAPRCGETSLNSRGFFCHHHSCSEFHLNRRHNSTR